jgi:hypothetical protein
VSSRARSKLFELQRIIVIIPSGRRKHTIKRSKMGYRGVIKDQNINFKVHLLGKQLK